MKPIVLSKDKWFTLRQEIDRTHPKSVTMVRWKMREVLGFTVREHREWREDYVELVPRTMIHLDFYDDSKRTFFLLKYGDWIR